MKTTKRSGEVDPVVVQLDSLKRLLILQLLSNGVQSSAIAEALGVDNAVVSRLVPARKLKKKLSA